MKDKFRKTAIIILAFWGLALIGAVIFYYFVIIPQKSTIKSLSTKVEQEIETNLVAAQAKEQRAAELMDFKIAQARGLIGDFIIDKNEVNNFVFDFKKMADEIGIYDFTGSHNPSTSYTSIGGYKTLQEGTMRINFSGDYSQFLYMVNSLERYRPIVFVDRFDISRTRLRERNNNINIHLIFFTNSETDKK